MKFIDKKISDSYYQVYIIFDLKEKKSILNSIKEELVYLKKEELKDQIKLYNSINKNGNSSYSFEKIKELKQQMDNMTIKNTTFANEEMQGYVDDYLQKDLVNHIEKLNIIPTLAYESTIIGNMNDNNPLTMVYSFSYIPKSFEMKFPKMKGNSYLFTSKDIDMIQTELLISNKMFNKRRVLYSTEFSDLTFSYMCEDDMKFNLCMDISEIESKFQIDRNELIGLNRNKYLIKNRLGKKCLINIEEIYDKDVYDITDEIVKKINYLNTKTIKELRKKIDEVFSFIYNVNSNVVSIIQSIARINDFNIDDYVIDHYKKIIEADDLDDKLYEEMKLSFVTGYIFGNFEINIEKYFFYIEQEYKLLYQIKKPEDEMSFEEYFSMKAPYYGLYEYFRQIDLVTERSYDE